MLWWTLKGSIILALAFAATALLRRRPAALRHAIWTVAVAAQFLVPLVPHVVPERTLAVPVPIQVQAIVPGPVLAAVPASTPATPATPKPARSPFDARTFLVAGSALLLLRLLFGTGKVVALARRSQRMTDGEWLSLHSRLCDALSISRPVTLRQSDALALPVTWGFLYPTVLLPAASREWPEALRRHVLLHELAHVRRADALTQLLGQAALVLYWFNPLLWLAVRRMQAEAENACDDYVLRDGELPSRYAATLFELVRAHRGPTPPAFATLAVGQRSDLEVRVDAITSPLRDPSSRRALLAAVIAIAVVVVVPLSALHPEGRREIPVAVKAGGMGCRPLLIKDAPFRETSGVMTLGSKSTNYFFLRPEADRCLEASFNLDARFTDDDRDLVPTPRLTALVHETRGGRDRAVYIEERSGGLAYRYLEDGRPAAWDRAAQRWYHDLLPDMIRRSEAGADARAKRIVDNEGVEGLFAELARMPLPDVRTRYLEALLALRTPAELPRSTLIGRAREELDLPEVSLTWFLAEVVYHDGAHEGVIADVLQATRALRNGAERSRVLKEMSHHRDPRVRVAAMDAIELLDPSWRRDLLQLSVPWYLGTNETLVEAWFRGLESIDKPSEREELLREVRQQELPAAILLRAAE